MTGFFGAVGGRKGDLPNIFFICHIDDANRPFFPSLFLKISCHPERSEGSPYPYSIQIKPNAIAILCPLKGHILYEEYKIICND